jgi:hypothetical protein
MKNRTNYSSYSGKYIKSFYSLAITRSTHFNEFKHTSKRQIKKKISAQVLVSKAGIGTAGD